MSLGPHPGHSTSAPAGAGCVGAWNIGWNLQEASEVSDSMAMAKSGLGRSGTSFGLQ